MTLITAVYTMAPEPYDCGSGCESTWQDIEDAAHCCIPELRSTLDKLYTITSYFRDAYSAMATAMSFAPLKNRFSPIWIDRFQNVLKYSEKPIYATTVFYIAGIFDDIPRFMRSVKKAVNRVGEKQFDAIQRVFSSLGSFCYNMSYTLYGYTYFIKELEDFNITALSSEYKGVYAVSSVLWYTSLIGSVADITISARRWYKARQFQNLLIKESGYNEKGEYTLASYKKLQNFINDHSTKILGKKFDIDGTLLQNQINTLLPAVSGSKTSLTDKEVKNLKIVMDALKQRLDQREKLQIIEIFDNTVYLAGCALMIAAIAQPYLFPVWSACYYSSLAVQYGYGQYINYSFQNQLGLIDRGTSTPSKYACLGSCPSVQNLVLRVEDFGKWYMGFYKQKSVSPAA